MKKLLYVMAFFLPFLAFTSCSKEDVSSTDQLPGTVWEGNIGLGDIIMGTLTVEFEETTYKATAEIMDINEDGELVPGETESYSGKYTVDGNYIYFDMEGVKEKAELRDGKIYLKITDEDGEELPMEFVLTQKK
ncbi:hypothetical protein [Bacteroides caecigallinarum]|uniref:hypothetical protein n=1 Tax=Bacteroides caecigallinarum TaxID=1411144 RepID=UPI001F1925B4|nr:hypothetical protein [Bacteroides caecigallinarum]MCF2738425.1 hypothetical protein [Bacteroides caecigallinarum]